MNLLTLAVSLITIPLSLSCDCVQYSDYKTLQQEFCEAEFVIGIAVVRHEGTGNDNADRKYEVHLKDIFKGNPVDVDRKFSLYKTTALYTYATEEKCGVTLLPKSLYVVGGKVEGGKNWISTCFLNYPGYDLPCNPKLFIEGCKHCKIKRCGSGYCSERNDECKYRRNQSKKRYDDACVPGSTGRCTWQECAEMTIFSTIIMGDNTPPPSTLDSLPHLSRSTPAKIYNPPPIYVPPIPPHPANIPNYFIPMYITSSKTALPTITLPPPFYTTMWTQPPHIPTKPPHKPSHGSSPNNGIRFWLEPNHFK